VAKPASIAAIGLAVVLALTVAMTGLVFVTRGPCMREVIDADPGGE
jgi:hypothetical protein